MLLAFHYLDYLIILMVFVFLVIAWDEHCCKPERLREGVKGVYENLMEIPAIKNSTHASQPLEITNDARHVRWLRRRSQLNVNTTGHLALAVDVLLVILAVAAVWFLSFQLYANVLDRQLVWATRLDRWKDFGDTAGGLLGTVAAFVSAFGVLTVAQSVRSIASAEQHRDRLFNLFELWESSEMMGCRFTAIQTVRTQLTSGNHNARSLAFENLIKSHSAEYQALRRVMAFFGTCRLMIEDGALSRRAFYDRFGSMYTFWFVHAFQHIPSSEHRDLELLHGLMLDLVAEDTRWFGLSGYKGKELRTWLERAAAYSLPNIAPSQSATAQDVSAAIAERIRAEVQSQFAAIARQM